MAEFLDADLSGSRFERVDLTGSDFRMVDFSGSRFRGYGLHGVVFRGGEISNAEIYGELKNLTINGVDVVPLIEAELNRLDPDRALMRPTDPAGFRQAWDVVERRWAATVEQANRLDPALLYESVDGEWSFIDTVRHLVFVTDSWVRRQILGIPAPWDPLSLPWDDMDEIPEVPWDREARPGLEEVLALRDERMATVREVIDGLTPDSLAADTAPAVGPGWPPEAATYSVRACLRVLLDEEWEHRLYAERDMTALEAKTEQR